MKSYIQRWTIHIKTHDQRSTINVHWMEFDFFWRVYWILNLTFSHLLMLPTIFAIWLIDGCVIIDSKHFKFQIHIFTFFIFIRFQHFKLYSRLTKRIIIIFWDILSLPIKFPELGFYFYSKNSLKKMKIYFFRFKRFDAWFKIKIIRNETTELCFYGSWHRQ